MIYTPLTMKAMKIAYDAHHGKLDRSGVPYIFHPLYVAEHMKSEDATVVALLHDVAEDTKVTLDDLRKEGFGEHIIAALRLLKHDKNVPYLEYIQNLSPNPLAREVKVIDLEHNCDPARVYRTNAKIYARFIKYGLALEILKGTEKEPFVSRPKEYRVEEVQLSAATVMKKAEELENGVYRTISGADATKCDNTFEFCDFRSRLTAKLARLDNGLIDVQLKLKDRVFTLGENAALDGEMMGYLEGIAQDVRNLHMDISKTQQRFPVHAKKNPDNPGLNCGERTKL